MRLFDIDLINRYNRSGPRYTSYPSANNFSEFSLEEYEQQTDLSSRRRSSISLYCHIPFCNTVCYYCGCNKVVTKDKAKAKPYLDALYKEIDMQSLLFDKTQIVKQMHFGGGTPTFLSGEQIIQLSNKLQQAFNFELNGEYSIEIDPRGIDKNLIESLAIARFNRISIGVQDFDLDVQKAVNRVQSFEQTKAVIDLSRKNGFDSISIDLIYGLPRQSKDTFIKTLEKVNELRPERISLFNYAHLPKLFKPQRRIILEELPSPAEKLKIFQYSLEYLIDQGYIYIGMDHFALPNDPLAIAQSEGNLYRNFQGYSTHSECDIIGLGVSSIGQVADSFSQNEKSLERYCQALESEQLPISKGLIVNKDDKIRRALIMELICHFEVNILKLEQRFCFIFTNYFAESVEKLQQMQNDGLIEFNSHSIIVMERGKLLVRNICMVFDSYLGSTEASFSKTI
jgi:oxygen-independent coproporphyrinogen III oxidase